MPNTSIIQDGSQKFAIADPTFQLFGTNTLVVESITYTDGTSRVDLNDGQGLPLGAVTVPARTEFSATVQVGASINYQPEVGNAYVHDGRNLVVTEVALAETQSDFRRYNISGYERTTDMLLIRLKKISGHANYTPTSVSGSANRINRHEEYSAGDLAVSGTGFGLPFGHIDKPTATTTYSITITTSGSAFDSGDSTTSSGVDYVTASCSTTLIKFEVGATATIVDLGYAITS